MWRPVRTTIRFVVLLGLVASLLVPAWIAPARAITIPVTLARTVRSDGAGRVGTAFAPTHIAFSWRGPERTGVEYRIFSHGRPSRWRRAVEAHDMEYGDHHFSGVIWVPRPSGLEWRKTGAKRALMGDITVDYLNTIDGPRKRVVVPATAEAGTSAPDIVTRRQWGADESLKRGCTREYNKVQQLFVHHTVGINNDPHPKATMRSIYWYHAVRRGWCDIGYNFVISPDGRVFEGRYARNYDPGEIHDGETKGGRIVTGAHVSSYNSGSVGVSLMGNYSQVRPSGKMRSSLVDFLAWEARKHDLKPRAEHTYRNPVTGLTRRLPVIAGHRDAGATECPGNYVYRALPSIRKDVARLVNKKPSFVTLKSNSDSVTFGETVDLAGKLKKKDGSPLTDRRIALKRRKAPDGSWRTVDSTRTLLDGSFSFTAEPVQNGAFKARFRGDERFRDSQSDRLRVRVQASVSLLAEGGTDIEGVPHFSAGGPVSFKGRVRPPHPNGPLVLVIKQLQLGAYKSFDKVDLELDENSRFVYEFAGAPTGGYRARAKFPAHADHARGVSPDLDFVIGP
jgi:hypothetical protein